MKKKIDYKIVLLNNELYDLYITNKNKRNNKDAGLDLYIPENMVVPGKSISYKIGLRIKASGYINDELSSYHIFPRSSMGAKTPLRLCNSIGLVDEEYTGELFIFVDNISENDYIIEKHSRLVQLVGPNHEYCDIEIVDNLENTNRNEKGIGSSGI